MAFYKSPIRPYDPVVEDSKDSGAIRYLRDDFMGTGQDSNMLPPAQEQSMWQQLVNVQPITQGVLSRRWGYSLLTDYVGANPITRMYSFQNNITLARQIVYSTQAKVSATSEDGDVNGNANLIYSPVASVAPRMVDSRNYGYFFDGVVADSKKWDGASSISNWGIAAPSPQSLSTLSGPRAGTTAISTTFGGGIAWANPTNALLSDAVYSTCSLGSAQSSNFLMVTGFGFTIPTTATIVGLKVEVQGFYSGTVTTAPSFITYMAAQGGFQYGANRTAIINKAPEAYSTFGDSTDLRNTTWTPALVNGSDFGVSIGATNMISGTATVSVDFVRITVYYSNITSAMLVAPSGGAGLVTLTVGRTYYCIYQNSLTGHLSDLNSASVSSGPVTAGQVSLTAIPVSSDPQVDTKVILATADGGDPSILYFVASLPNSQTTYFDNTPETTLLLNQQYLFTDPFGNEFGITFNDPPPTGSLCVKHKGRLWMAQQQNLFFSKSVAELTLPNGFIAGKYEECWPPQDYFDISGGAETISGLLSDGVVVYIGTQSHIRRIFGDSPTNFQQPEICHQNVGVLNQETWQNIFLEGTPLGFMWLTPDFKVMGSDGNTYVDVGHPIQDVLNSINPAQAQLSHAMFVQQGPYSLYILAIPTDSNPSCDTHCVFDVVNKHWSIWKPTDPSTSMLFNVTATGASQWLFATFGLNPSTALFELILPPVFSTVPLHSNLLVYQYSSSATQDRVGNTALNFLTTATTTWLHMGMPTTRKVLDSMEIVGDSTMLVTVEGASSQVEFNSPTVIIANAPLILSQELVYKLYLAGRRSRFKYYRFTFKSISGTDINLLNSYNIRVIPWNTN